MAYVVRRPARTVTEFVVFASSARQAVERLHGGHYYEVLESETVGTGRGAAKRAPEYDDA